ncbi:MAG: hypothetical protein ABI682_08640 [Acidobacteriota bacterium]
MVALAIAQPAAAAQPADVREPGVLQTFRANYDAMMANFERMAKATGNTARQERASQGRKAMRMVTDDQLIKSFGQNEVPDLSAGVMNSQYLASQMESQQKAAEGKRPMATRTAGFPEPVAVVAGCNGVDVTAETRYTLFIAKEVVNAILAAAAWACNGRMDDYLSWLKSDYLPALQTAGVKHFVVSRPIFGGEGGEVVSSRMLENLAEIDGGPVLTKALGEAQARAVNARALPLVRSSTTSIVKVRADLTYSTDCPPAN